MNALSSILGGGLTNTNPLSSQSGAMNPLQSSFGGGANPLSSMIGGGSGSGDAISQLSALGEQNTIQSSYDTQEASLGANLVQMGQQMLSSGGSSS